MAYITSSALKATLNIGSTYADSDVTVAIEAASRACDGYKGVAPGMFATLPQVRVYSPQSCDAHVDIDPLNTLSTLKIDTDGNGTYDTTWTSGTDFVLQPPNGNTDGIPYDRVLILPQSGRSFSGYVNGVQVTGTFGWSTTPYGVTQATTILAGRLLKRARETPNGIQTVAGDIVAAARLGRVDPDVAFLLDNLPGKQPLLAL